MSNLFNSLQEKNQVNLKIFSFFSLIIYVIFYPVLIYSTEIYGALITIPVIGLSLLGKKSGMVSAVCMMILNTILEIFILHAGFAKLMQWIIPKLLVILLAYIIGSYADLYSDKVRLLKDVKNNLEEIKELRELLPICVYCKSIRNNEGYWEHVDQYLQSAEIATFSHGICDDCLNKIQIEYQSKDD